MASQPSEEDINNFIAFTGARITREQIIARLKGNNNNLDQAIGEYFDDPDSDKYTYSWDESAFASDREGVPNNHGVSFDIQAPDVPAPTAYNNFDGSGLASRPPSRTSHNKSPLSKIIDLTAEHAMADPKNSISFIQHADSDLEQALAASRAEAGMPPQESGITDTNEVHFGPANRDQYDAGQWAMVPIGKSTVQEILPDPEPAERKRDLDVPAFLKPSVEDHRLGALLTIYHEIPLIRDIFVPCVGQDMAPNYGYDKEWWNGKSIDRPEVFGDDVIPPNEVNLELQRLMAFLDKTDRSYGSVDALASMETVKRMSRTRTAPLESHVLEAWKNGVTDDRRAKLSKIFSRGTESEAQEANERIQEFGILELELPNKEDSQSTLYDIADEAMWPELEPLNLDDSPYLPHVADVIAFEISSDYHALDKKNVEIPAVWYPDRYMKPARQYALDMRLRKKEIQEDLYRNEKMKETFTTYELRNGKSIPVKDLFEVALQHDQTENPEFQTPSDEDRDPSSQESAKKIAQLSAQLRDLALACDRKLSALNQEHEKLLEDLHKVSALYTDQSSEGAAAASELHKYTLRGVSTTKNTFYVCRRAESDLIDMDLDGDGPMTKNDQWWRIHFGTSGSNPISIEKTTEEKVLEAANTESKDFLLVYASERAMDFEVKALPPALEAFVRTDNKQFKAELAENEDSQAHISSPGKRKWEESSNGSAERDKADGEAAQNMATHLGSEGTGRDYIEGVDPRNFEQNTGRLGQEMQERSSTRMMASLTKGGHEKQGTIDGMDLDEVAEDDKMARESAAVKQAGSWAS